MCSDFPGSKFWIEFELRFEKKRVCGIMICGMNKLGDSLKFVFSPGVILLWLTGLKAPTD